MANKEQFTPDKIIAALKQAKGYVSNAAGILGCTCPTIYNYANRYPDVRIAWDDIKEARHDAVEMKLHDQIDSGNVAAIIFYLKTQAKHRGYVEKQIVEHELPFFKELIPHVQNGTLHYSDVVVEVGESLAQELFKKAGVPHDA